LPAFDSACTSFPQGFHGIPDFIDEITPVDRSISGSYSRDPHLYTQQANYHERGKREMLKIQRSEIMEMTSLNRGRICVVLITRGHYSGGMPTASIVRK